jgi:hypothetical protein
MLEKCRNLQHTPGVLCVARNRAMLVEEKGRGMGIIRWGMTLLTSVALVCNIMGYLNILHGGTLSQDGLLSLYAAVIGYNVICLGSFWFDLRLGKSKNFYGEDAA